MLGHCIWPSIVFAMFTASYNKKYLVECILKLIRRHADTECLLARKLTLARMQLLVPAVYPRRVRQYSEWRVLEEDYLIRGYRVWTVSCRKYPYFTRLCLCKLVFFFHIRKQSSLINDLVVNVILKSDSSIAVPVKEASDSCAAAVYLT